MTTDFLKIEKYEIVEVDPEGPFGDSVQCTVTVDLECGLQIDGYVTCDCNRRPDWSTFDPITVVDDEYSDTVGA